MADIKEILENNPEAFEGTEIEEKYQTLTEKLDQVGYNVLINNKEKNEFVPSSRLSEVVKQRDSFKSKVEELNSQLQQMQDGSKDEELKKQLSELMENNNKLLQDLETTRVDTAIMLEAKDAIDANDILKFINRENIKIDGRSGEVKGAADAVEELRKSKPYLFNKEKAKAGTESKNSVEQDKSTMNSLIRRAAGRV